MPGINYAGSGEQILGKNSSLMKLKLCSNELHVTRQTSPAFIVPASNDDGIPPENSPLFTTL